jgi:hypothetical protein
VDFWVLTVSRVHGEGLGLQVLDSWFRMYGIRFEA